MSTTAQKTILVVEDEAILAMSQMNLLNTHGYNVIHISNGEKTEKITSKCISSPIIPLMDRY